MIRRILTSVLLVLLLSSSAVANGWRWVGAGGGLSYRVNADNVHDGWLYSQRCGQYYQYSKAPVAYAAKQQSGVVNYSANWKLELVRAVNAQKDNELFIEAVRESGLSPRGVQPHLLNYANGSNYLRGTSVYTSGVPYAQQGSTLYGLAAYAPNIGQVNIEGILAQQARLAEQMGGVAGQTNLAFSDRVQQVGEAQLEITKIQEAYRGVAETLRASQTPRTSTHQWESGADQGLRGQALRGVTPGESERLRAARGAPPAPRSALARVKADALLTHVCASCHGDKKSEANFSVLGFANWTEDQLADYGEEILNRVKSNDPDYMMPPPNKGIDSLSREEIRILEDGIYPGESASSVRINARR